MNLIHRISQSHVFIEAIGRWLLGSIFVFAAFHKMVAPDDFARILYGYKLMPGLVINLVAITLPFIELFCGLSLLMGLHVETAAIIVNGLLTVMIFLICINLLRGHEFNCGCFGSSNQGAAAPEWVLVRDGFLLLLGLSIWGYRIEKIDHDRRPLERCSFRQLRIPNTSGLSHPV